jgi:hypothetical protein
VRFCPACERAIVEPQQPLILEWWPDSAIVGDFTWPGARVVVRADVMSELSRHFKGAESGPLEMWQNPRLKRPKRVTKRTTPRVWLPYEGPPLVELWVSAWVTIDETRSSLVGFKCSACGFIRGTIDGVEEKPGDVTGQGLAREHIRRRPRAGLLIPRAALQNCDIFRASQAERWVLCTEPVKRFIQERGYTNIDFWEVGETFESSA